MTDLPPVDSPVHLHDPQSSYHCRVEESDDGSVLLVPNADTTGEPPRTGDWLTLSWVTVRGSCELPVRFAGADTTGGRVLWKVSAAGETEVIQRRRYARASVEAPVEFSTVDAIGQETVRGGWLLDVSEGGVRCTFPMGTVEEGEEVEIRFDLDAPVRVHGSVLRVTPREGRAYVVATFDASPAMADRIRSYVFARQLTERRRLTR